MLSERLANNPLQAVAAAGELYVLLSYCQPQSGMTDCVFNRDYRQATASNALALTEYPRKVSRAIHSHGSAKLCQVMLSLRGQRD